MSRTYIAYGSNLNLQQMYHRCPGSELMGTGVIHNYELQFKGSPHGAHATIAPKEGSSVPVAIWSLGKRDERMLDCYEGYPSYYFKRMLPVQMGEDVVVGMAYIMNQKMDFGIPSDSYVQTVRQGYVDCGLDTDVLDNALTSSQEMAQPRLASMEGMNMY